MVNNPPSNAGYTGSIPGRGIKMPQATGQLSPRATTIELARLNKRARVPETTEPTCSGHRALLSLYPVSQKIEWPEDL